MHTSGVVCTYGCNLGSKPANYFCFRVPQKLVVKTPSRTRAEQDITSTRHDVLDNIPYNRVEIEHDVGVYEFAIHCLDQYMPIGNDSVGRVALG